MQKEVQQRKVLVQDEQVSACASDCNTSTIAVETVDTAWIYISVGFGI